MVPLLCLHHRASSSVPEQCPCRDTEEAGCFSPEDCLVYPQHRGCMRLSSALDRQQQKVQKSSSERLHLSLGVLSRWDYRSSVAQSMAGIHPRVLDKVGSTMAGEEKAQNDTEEQILLCTGGVRMLDTPGPAPHLPVSPSQPRVSSFCYFRASCFPKMSVFPAR